MNKILIISSIIIGKLIAFLSKLTGHKSSSMPGKFSRAIFHGILTHLWNQVSLGTIIITGTNGKTTTNNILRDILKQSGYSVVCNDLGANMINGITTAFIKNSSIWGKINADYACLEVDEATFPKVLDELTPTRVVITNLFRDQLDRYGEIDLTAQYIDNGLLKLKDKDVHLFLNSDDPLTSQFKFKHSFEVKFFGIEAKSNVPPEESREGRFCTFCGAELKYNNYFYSQLGDYYCEKCGFERPALDYKASNINLKNGEFSFDFIYNNDLKRINMNYGGFYNIYNCLAAIGCSMDIVNDFNDITKALDKYSPQIGRMEKFNISKPVILNLAKNPTGFNQTIDLVISDDRLKNVLIIINDNEQDGQDISWLWDCDFERLSNTNINKFIVSGIRKEDMALRLKYGQVPLENIFIEEDIKRAIFKLVDDNAATAYIMVNYTALFETQSILKSIEKAYGTPPASSF